MGKKILIALAVLAGIVVVFLVIVAMQPADYQVERSIKINAPPDVVFSQVNDFRNWENWSPWAKLDPDVKYTYDGSTDGEGAIIHWSGNDKVGEGCMTLTECKENSLIRIKLEFVRPFEDSCTTEFNFTPEGEQTKVTWTMSGEHNFMSKMFCLFMDIEAMIGGDFEKGLAQMKEVAENVASK